MEPYRSDNQENYGFFHLFRKNKNPEKGIKNARHGYHFPAE